MSVKKTKPTTKQSLRQKEADEKNLAVAMSACVRLMDDPHASFEEIKEQLDQIAVQCKKMGVLFLNPFLSSSSDLASASLPGKAGNDWNGGLIHLLYSANPHSKKLIDHVLDQYVEPSIQERECLHQSLALFEATNVGTAHLVKKLTTLGCDVHRVMNNKQTPLHIAAGSINPQKAEIIEVLLENGANPNALDGENRTPSLGLIQSYKAYLERENPKEAILKSLKILIKAGARVSKMQGSGAHGGELHKAAHSGLVEVMGLLFEQGANVNEKTEDTEWTPLQFAAQNQQAEAIDWLLRHGADAHVKSAGGDNLLNVMVKRYDRVEMLQKIPNLELSINEQDQEGRTALHLAAMHNRKNITLFLMHHGAKTSLLDRSGKTPVEVARQFGLDELAEIIDGAVLALKEKDILMESSKEASPAASAQKKTRL